MPELLRQVTVEPVRDRSQRLLAAEIVLEQPPYARDVGEIGGLAVAPPQPRENAGDLVIALRRKDRGGAGKGGAGGLRKRRGGSMGQRGAPLVGQAPTGGLGRPAGVGRGGRTHGARG